MTFSRNLEFYKISPDEADLTNILEEIYKSRGIDAENNGVLEIVDPATQVYLQKFNKGSNFCEGLMVKQRTEDIPKKGNYAKNAIEDFKLEPKEGFAEMTYFVYIPQVRVLALLAGKNGVKCGLFISYIKQLSAAKGFGLEIVLNQHAKEQLDRFGNISKILWKVQFANGYSVKSPLIQSKSTFDMLKTKEQRYLTVGCEYSNPRRSGGMNADGVKSFVSGLLANAEEHAKLKSISVKGSEDYEQDEIVLDLLTNKFKIKTELSQLSSLDYNECQKRIRPIVLAQQGTLKELLGDL